MLIKKNAVSFFISHDHVLYAWQLLKKSHAIMTGNSEKRPFKKLIPLFFILYVMQIYQQIGSHVNSFFYLMKRISQLRSFWPLWPCLIVSRSLDTLERWDTMLKMIWTLFFHHLGSNEISDINCFAPSNRKEIYGTQNGKVFFCSINLFLHVWQNIVRCTNVALGR